MSDTALHALGKVLAEDRGDGAFTLIVEPGFNNSGNASVSAGATFTSLSAQPCRQVTIVNSTTQDIEVQQDGAGVAIPVLTSTVFTFLGLSNMNQLAVRRADQNSNALTVFARWEG
ncbi:hypothetical protein [Roseibium alexandrii]|uniref:hypothetical protein n=1 Tax=Roseibium alexandrii TaxID=388408 RepID=UPI003753A08C